MSISIKLLADASLHGLSELFDSRFILTRFANSEEAGAQIHSHDVLLCRSTLRVNENLLKNSAIKCVATASSGIDHIDDTYLKLSGVQLFDAKGANAQAVADYVVAALAALHQMKKPLGRLAGVVGVGHVGTCVMRRLRALNFDVVCFDPLKSQQDKTFVSATIDELHACDLICIHANLHDNEPFPSLNLFNAELLMKLKPGVIIINAARGGIVDEQALLNRMETITYCTDVYSKEPTINHQIVDMATICTPHIAGHSIEAIRAAVTQVSHQIHKYYNLTPSHESAHAISHPHIFTYTQPWHEQILNLYDPRLETYNLKHASDKTAAFLRERRAHTSRHDFNCYK